MEQSGVLTKIVAGGVAGVSETLVTYPAEFVKTRRQLHFTSSSSNGAAAATGATPNPPGSLSILRDTVARSGVRGVYSGVQALAASNAAKSGIRFLAFESTRSRLDALAGRTSVPENGHQRQPRAAWVNVVSGLAAGVAESIAVVTPGEAIKTKMIHDASSDGVGGGRFAGRGLLGAVGMLVREEGLRGLWRGLTPVLCKQGTNSAVRFTTFAMLQERVAVWWPALDGSVGSTLVLGGISGVFTVYASMPFDNIKTRMQSVNARYKGMLDCAAQTLREDGVLAFWRGTSPRLVRLTLSSGITFTVYDQVVRLIKSAQADRDATDLQRV